MNGDALSDLVLAAVCAWIVWRAWTMRPGLALAVATVGLAAVIGIADFSGVSPARGPHQFASMLSATAGLPLLAVALCWPKGDTALRPPAAARFLVVAAGLAIALVVGFDFGMWRQIAPGLAAVAILAAAIYAREPIAVIGALVLAASFVITATQASVGPFNATQGLHITMAAAFILLHIVAPRAAAA